MPEDLSPLIGIFWMISAADGARLLAASCVLDEAVNSASGTDQD
jgi:hypothetical protein